MTKPEYTSTDTALLLVDPYNDFLSEGRKSPPTRGPGMLLCITQTATFCCFRESTPCQIADKAAGSR